MPDDGPLGLGLMKGRRYGNPRSETERAERHKRLTGSSNTPVRGSGNGILGLGILPSMQKRVDKITRNTLGKRR